MHTIWIIYRYATKLIVMPCTLLHKWPSMLLLFSLLRFVLHPWCVVFHEGKYLASLLTSSGISGMPTTCGHAALCI